MNHKQRNEYRGIINTHGTSCHTSSALQLVFHCFPKLRNALLEVALTSAAAAGTATTATNNNSIDDYQDTTTTTTIIDDKIIHEEFVYQLSWFFHLLAFAQELLPSQKEEEEQQQTQQKDDELNDANSKNTPHKNQQSNTTNNSTIIINSPNSHHKQKKSPKSPRRKLNSKEKEAIHDFMTVARKSNINNKESGGSVDQQQRDDHTWNLAKEEKWRALVDAIKEEERLKQLEKKRMAKQLENKRAFKESLKKVLTTTVRGVVGASATASTTAPTAIGHPTYSISTKPIDPTKFYQHISQYTSNIVMMQQSKSSQQQQKQQQQHKGSNLHINTNTVGDAAVVFRCLIVALEFSVERELTRLNNNSDGATGNGDNEEKKEMEQDMLPQQQQQQQKSQVGITDNNDSISKEDQKEEEKKPQPPPPPRTPPTQVQKLQKVLLDVKDAMKYEWNGTLLSRIIGTAVTTTTSVITTPITDMQGDDHNKNITLFASNGDDSGKPSSMTASSTDTTATEATTTAATTVPSSTTTTTTTTSTVVTITTLQRTKRNGTIERPVPIPFPLPVIQQKIPSAGGMTTTTTTTAGTSQQQPKDTPNNPQPPIQNTSTAAAAAAAITSTDRSYFQSLTTSLHSVTIEPNPIRGYDWRLMMKRGDVIEETFVKEMVDGKEKKKNKNKVEVDGETLVDDTKEDGEVVIWANAEVGSNDVGDSGVDEIASVFEGDDISKAIPPVVGKGEGSSNDPIANELLQQQDRVQRKDEASDVGNVLEDVSKALSSLQLTSNGDINNGSDSISNEVVVDAKGDGKDGSKNNKPIVRIEKDATYAAAVARLVSAQMSRRGSRASFRSTGASSRASSFRSVDSSPKNNGVEGSNTTPKEEGKEEYKSGLSPGGNAPVTPGADDVLSPGLDVITGMEVGGTPFEEIGTPIEQGIAAEYSEITYLPSPTQSYASDSSSESEEESSIDSMVSSVDDSESSSEEEDEDDRDQVPSLGGDDTSETHSSAIETPSDIDDLSLGSFTDDSLSDIENPNDGNIVTPVVSILAGQVKDDDVEKVESNNASNGILIRDSNIGIENRNIEHVAPIEPLHNGQTNGDVTKKLNTTNATEKPIADMTNVVIVQSNHIGSSVQSGITTNPSSDSSSGSSSSDSVSITSSSGSDDDFSDSDDSSSSSDSSDDDSSSSSSDSDSDRNHDAAALSMSENIRKSNARQQEKDMWTTRKETRFCHPLPNSLIFHLKRFEYSPVFGRVDKLSGELGLPEEIDLSPCCLDQQGKSNDECLCGNRYHLTGAIVHVDPLDDDEDLAYGDALEGHYVTYCAQPSYSKTKKKVITKWIEMDDDAVHTVHRYNSNIIEEEQVPVDESNPVADQVDQKKEHPAIKIMGGCDTFIAPKKEIAAVAEKKDVKEKERRYATLVVYSRVCECNAGK